MRKGRGAGLPVAWRHLTGNQVQGTEEPKRGFADYSRISRGPICAARSGGPNPVRGYPRYRNR